MNSTVTEILKNINIDPIAKIYFVNPTYKSQEDKYKIARLNTNDSVTKAVKDVVKKYMELIKDRKKIPIDKIDKGDEDYVATLPIEKDILTTNLNQRRNVKRVKRVKRDCKNIIKSK